MKTLTRKRAAMLAGGAAIAVTVLCTAGSCGNNPQPTGQQEENQQQRQDTTSLEASQPIPHYDWSQIRQTTIDAEDIAARGAQTTSFFFQMGDQDPVYSCPSIGMPVPVTAQLSNPDQVTPDPNASAGSVVTGQMDPDGIYTSPDSSGTNVICVNGGGAKYLMYWEGDVLAVTGPAEWNEASHTIKVTGAPTATVHTSPTK